MIACEKKGEFESSTPYKIVVVCTYILNCLTHWPPESPIVHKNSTSILLKCKVHYSKCMSSLLFPRCAICTTYEVVLWRCFKCYITCNNVFHTPRAHYIFFANVLPRCLSFCKNASKPSTPSHGYSTTQPSGQWGACFYTTSIWVLDS